MFQVINPIEINKVVNKPHYLDTYFVRNDKANHKITLSL